MFEFGHSLIPEIDALTQQHPEAKKVPFKDVANHRVQVAIVSKALDLITRDQSNVQGRDVSKMEAMAWLAHYWMVKEGIDQIHENPLLDPTEYGHELEPGRLQRAWEWLNSEI